MSCWLIGEVEEVMKQDGALGTEIPATQTTTVFKVGLKQLQ